MLAARVHALGGPDAIQVESVATPATGPGKR
jgi:hypothetical protein